MNRRKFLELSSTGSIAVGIVPVILTNSALKGSNNESLQKIDPIKAPFDMPKLQRPVFPNKTFDIREFGAKGDGKIKNTGAFAQAIAACANGGGGKVLVPEGKWLTGAIHLKSNVNLHMEMGAEIHFSDIPDDYLPVIFTRWAGFEIFNYSSLIYAIDCENIAITGPGKLYGHGRAWWSWGGSNETGLQMQAMVLKGVPPEKRVFGKPEYGLRPQFINTVRCRNVLLEDFTVDEPGPFWTTHILYCENVIIRKLTIHAMGGPNLDGIDLDSSRNVLVEHCILDTGDNALCLKSGINEDGWRVGRPTENIVMRHISTVGKGAGGIAIGSEMSGGVRNVLAHDCQFLGTALGIRLKSNSSRGGIIEKIWFKDITMKDVRTAISIDTDYTAWMTNKDGKAYPIFRDIEISNINCDGASVAAIVNGQPKQPIERVVLNNIFIKAEKGMTFNWVNNSTLRNVKSEPNVGVPILFMNCKNVDKES